MEQISLVYEHRDNLDRDLLLIIENFDWVGSGAGTFEYAFPGYVSGNYGCYDHP